MPKDDEGEGQMPTLGTSWSEQFGMGTKRRSVAGRSMLLGVPQRMAMVAFESRRKGFVQRVVRGDARRERGISAISTLKLPILRYQVG